MTLQPVGPLPASTYWRRRAVLGLVALLGLVLLLRACGGSSDDPALVSSRPTPSPSSTRTPEAPPVSLAATPSPSPTGSAPPSVCCDAALTVTAESDAQTYRSGAAPRFTLTVTNAGPVPCRRALGPDVVELRVFSGEDRIWSSDDCSSGKGQGVLLLAAGEARALTVQWPGKRTKPGCVMGKVALAGTYRVSARVGPIVRQGSIFRITD